MKKLELKNGHYQQIQVSFASWLKVRGYSQSSIYLLPIHIREFLHYQEQKNKELKDWEEGDFGAFMSYYQGRQHQRKAGALSIAQINKMGHALDLLQDYLKQLELIDFYSKTARIKASPKPLNIWTVGQIESLYLACKSNIYGARNKAVLSLCYACGLRKSEAINLELADIWWDRAVLQVKQSKTKVARLVPITPRVLEDLDYYFHKIRPILLAGKASSYFLVNNRGKQLSKGSIYSSFIRLVKRAELPVNGLHTLRHSIASHLAQSGMPSEQIAQFLGHKSLDSTQIYVHLQSK